MSHLKSDLFTDKPISLSVKDYLIRKMAVKMMMSEKTIEAVVNHQFVSAQEAMSTNKSVEISGFGKFYFNQKKAEQQFKKHLSQKELFERMLSTDLSETKRRNISLKLQTALDGIRDLKPKVYDSITDIRGVEEQPISSQEVERVDQVDQ